jgi:hypothetical protein
MILEIFIPVFVNLINLFERFQDDLIDCVVMDSPRAPSLADILELYGQTVSLCFDYDILRLSICSRHITSCVFHQKHLNHILIRNKLMYL